MPIPRSRSLVAALLAFAANANAAPVGDMFPPVDRILAGVRAPRPAMPVEADLRDGLAPARDILTFRAELRSADWQRRRAAITDRAWAGNKAAVPYIGASLLRLNEDGRVRVAAAMALGTIGDRAGSKFLLRALKDPEVDVRFATALALGSGFEGMVSPLSQALAEDPSWWVRYAAAVSLGKTGKAFAVDALGGAAAGDPSWQVRLQACRSLGELKSLRAAEALSAPLRDVDPGVRAAAAIALGEVGGEAAIERLSQELQEELEPFQRSVLTQAIRKALR